MYGLTGTSHAQRIVLAVLLACWVVLCWWILYCGGLSLLSRHLFLEWEPGPALRRALLGSAFTVYFVRVLITVFVFLRRGMGWTEVFTIAPWALCIFLLFAILGGFNASPVGLLGSIGVALFLFGSWMNTWAEFQRHRWKLRAENKGKLYTLGLFRIARHPNYLGDLISFTGLCLIAGRLVTAVVPVLMLAGFVFVNIPVLDAHLRQHYGPAFDDYAKRTSRLIPFLY
jgi:protein-S-isoprenylcysteine O-methyltransferase Ste14